MNIISKAIALSTVLLTAACLVACGSEESTPAPQPAKVAPKPQAPAQPADPTAKMARAVPSGKSGAAVDLKYEVTSKPEPGKPIAIELALIPGSVTDSMTVHVAGSPGLEVVANPTGMFGALKIGEVANHTVSVRAERAEMLYLTITATLSALNINSVRTFAIPLIFTDAAADAKVTTTAEPQPQQDATGQKIESMKAEEK